MLHHVELYVSDLRRSAAFWSWLLEQLGYEPFQEWENGVSWRCGETYLVFVQAEERFLDIPYHRCRVGLNHLAFHARSRRQVLLKRFARFSAAGRNRPAFRLFGCSLKHHQQLPVVIDTHGGRSFPHEQVSHLLCLGIILPWTNGTCFTQTGAVPRESGTAPVPSLY